MPGDAIVEENSRLFGQTRQKKCFFTCIMIAQPVPISKKQLGMEM